MRPSSGLHAAESPYPDQTLVHVHPDASELGRVYRPTLAINASPHAFARAFADAGRKRRWADRTATLHGAYLGRHLPHGSGAVHMGPIMEHLEDVLRKTRSSATAQATSPPDASLHRFRNFATRAPTSGSMGYGLPAGAPPSAFPGREVIVWAGDGDFPDADRGSRPRSSTSCRSSW